MGRGVACRSVRRAPTGSGAGTPGTGCQRARLLSKHSSHLRELTPTAAHTYGCSLSSASAVPSAVSPGTAQAQRSSSALARRAGACPAPPRPHSSKAFCPDPSRRPPWRYPGPEGAAPHTSRAAQGGEGGHGPDPRPAPVCPASPARHGGEPRAVAEGLRGGTGGSAAVLRPRRPELTPPRRRPRPLGCGRAPQPSVTQGSPPGPAHTFPIKAKKHGMVRLRSGRTGEAAGQARARRLPLPCRRSCFAPAGSEPHGSAVSVGWSGQRCLASSHIHRTDGTLFLRSERPRFQPVLRAAHPRIEPLGEGKWFSGVLPFGWRRRVWKAYRNSSWQPLLLKDEGSSKCDDFDNMSSLPAHVQAYSDVKWNTKSRRKHLTKSNFYLCYHLLR